MIVKLSMGSLCHISNVIVDSDLQQEDIDGYLKEGIALDEECMKRREEENKRSLTVKNRHSAVF